MPKQASARQALWNFGTRAAMALAVLALQPAVAEPIFKCGKTFTNVPPGSQPAQVRSRDCALVDTAAPPKARTERIDIDGSRLITVPVGQDGRFWIRGTVNGFPVQFVIDRNSTVNAGVAVTEDFAAKANLIGGAPSYVQTASATTDARRLERVRVTFGPFRVLQATVLVGSTGGKSTDAVLGRELLSLFDVTANDRELTIVGR